MVTAVLKRIAAQMPPSIQHELRRMFFRSQIRRGRFLTDEKEYALLDKFIAPGDWVLDIGANVGHYTMRMAELVGPSGRVVAVEPVPETFALLAGNARLASRANVTLLNVAASDRTTVVSMQIPDFADGLANYYQARLSTVASSLTVLTLSVDALALSHRVTLVKIDVEGHEMSVLRGMHDLLARDQPVLIVETASEQTVDMLHDGGYVTTRLPGSSNLICRPRTGAGDTGMEGRVGVVDPVRRSLEIKA